jgi:hypothetical protein
LPGARSALPAGACAGAAFCPFLAVALFGLTTLLSGAVAFGLLGSALVVVVVVVVTEDDLAVSQAVKKKPPNKLKTKINFFMWKGNFILKFKGAKLERFFCSLHRYKISSG